MVGDGGRGWCLYCSGSPGLPQGLCPQSHSWVFSVILTFPQMAANLCLVYLMALVKKRASCPYPAVGDFSRYWCRILGPGCILRLLQSRSIFFLPLPLCPVGVRVGSPPLRTQGSCSMDDKALFLSCSNSCSFFQDCSLKAPILPTILIVCNQKSFKSLDVDAVSHVYGCLGSMSLHQPTTSFLAIRKNFSNSSYP